MIKESTNKIIGEKDFENKKINVDINSSLQEFFFPEYQITVKADSLENAQKKLLEIINNKKQNV